MSQTRHYAVRRLARLMLSLAVLLLTAWGALALWHQMPQPAARWIAIGLWIAAGLAMLITLTGLPSRRARRLTGMLFVAAVAILASWWSTLQPSHQRLWADDVAQLLEARVDGNLVHLENVRNFEWRSETDYTPRWEQRSYNLDRLSHADLVLSYWMGPHIAHTLVSFGFDDGEQIVFSLEIRKEHHESFSAIGGFFRQFEQTLVAADERDILRTRSNVRGEDVYLYRLQMEPADVRALFLAYLEAANGLRSAPRFYNTLTSNCTTVVFELARLITPNLPTDYRLLLSGHFAEYVHDLGGLVPGYRYPELQSLGYINQRALGLDASQHSFSTAIRLGVPGTAIDEKHP
ncbi:MULTISPECIES: Lnb N-terminal periplasmic domain-containing protein [Pseudomonas]|uniref:DUF4105 domain-containing protein n=1 Tax=Pseudomonas helleri TaxID=1608996 RepID=A0A6L5HTR8_9PSED|nr:MULTISPECIES: DUF4105 domain-containing protein [Pseudomonas]MQT47893.1 DUF4105 domain-containing protein [Pseudomonas helleri]MQT60256.1 DUF4105 domain-containing protein [Pseudomonas sp. FSL R10-0399]MQT88738.1 DUF4105 domain-containing protein [Pseudomonas helleri]MQU06448.1 DUF4105 domain-containing protein [Pseudomonas helleri]